MSYILDALQKSEQERQQQQAIPTISAVHETPLTTSSPKLSTAWWLVILLSIVLIAIVGYLLFGNNKTSSTQQPNVTIATPNQITTSPQNNQQSQTLEQAQIQVQAPTQAQTESESVTKNITTESSGTNTTPSDNTKAQSKISELYRSAKETRIEQDSIPVVLSNDNITEVDLTRSVTNTSDRPQTQNNEPEPQETQTPEEQAPVFPSIYQLPDVVQSEIPPIHYIAHVYSSDVSKGFVILNNVKLIAGRRLQGELYLEKVDKDHVVMSFKGYLFTLPSMTNWEGRY